MEVQFAKKEFTWLRQLTDQLVHQEQTQELILDDAQLPVLQVQGIWGQTLIRGKQWSGDSLQLNGGVQVWILYTGPEQTVCGAKAWIPFQIRCDCRCGELDGVMQAQAFLRELDARVITDRKLILKASVDAQITACSEAKGWFYCPDGLPSQIRVLERTYPVCLPMEAGEKQFELDEELSLPAACPTMEKLLRYDVRPELIDKKVMADKVVFRGNALLHVLYLGQDGQLYSWDFEIPFSEFSDLSGSYGEKAQSQVNMAVTSVELEAASNGNLYLKCGLLSQYRICDQKQISLVEDAYCTDGTVSPAWEQTDFQSVVQMESHAVRVEQTLPLEGSRIADVSFRPDAPAMLREQDGTCVDLGGSFQMLYYDRDGQLLQETCRWNGSQYISGGQDTRLHCTVSPSGVAQATITGTGAIGRIDLLLSAVTIGEESLKMISGLQWNQQPDTTRRPSLILRKANGQSLWELAKATGSTVEAIRKANHLEDTVPEDRMLLIPV